MKRLLGTLALLVMFAGSASAGPITTGTFGTTGAFWQNASYDGNHINGDVGSYLRNTSGHTELYINFYDRTPALTSLSWLGDGSTFLWDITQLDVTHLMSVTGWPSDEWGIYQGDMRIPLGTAPWGGTGMTTGIWSSSTWGFYLTRPDGITWTSGTLDNGRSHFALFQGDAPRTWYIGIEDMSANADWDYNDVILRLEEPAPVPEPGSMLMIATGLGFVGLLKRKWRQ